MHWLRESTRLALAPTLRARRSFVVALTAPLLMCGLLTACGGGSTGGSPTRGKVVFGANTELSGSFQVYGVPVQQGLKGAAAQLNATGGIQVAGKSYRAAYHVEDNRSDPSQVATGSHAVVDSGAIAAVGPDVGATVSYQIWKSSNIITFTPAYDLQAQLQSNPRGNPLLFSLTPFVSHLEVLYLQHTLAEFPKIKSLAVIEPDDAQGKGSEEAFVAAAHAVHLKVKTAELFPDGTTDFSAVLTAIKAKHPDLLVAEYAPQDVETIFQQADQLQVAPYGLSDGLTPDQALQVKAKRMTQILPNFDPSFSRAATIPGYHPNVVFGKSEPAGAPGAGIVAYYAYQLLVEAMKKAGTTTNAQSIAKQLPGLSYNGPFGTCSVTANHELLCQTPLDVIKGNAVTVYQFAQPYTSKTLAVFTCKNGVCTAKR